MSKLPEPKSRPFDEKAKDSGDDLDELRILAGRTHLHRAQPVQPNLDSLDMSLPESTVEVPAPESEAFINEVPDNVALEAELMWSELMAMVTEAKWSM